METKLKLYNSRSGTVEVFEPKADPVTMYVCGITPYDTTHLGHIFTYASADVLIRFLRYRGFKVKYVQNLTDIDDPILREAKKQNEDWKELGNRWTIRFIEDMKLLNVKAPDIFPRATDVISGIIATTGKLLENGCAYPAGGNVYFQVSKWKDFGKMSGIPPEQMLSVANERGNHPDDPNKRDPLDFPLWQAQQAGEPAWESPWGPGRPGWHIECSTMSSQFLGDTIDIHGGGSDLIFPHHEGEIAQSECATGRHPFVRYWFHTAMVHYRGKKISKSLGNLIMVRDVLKNCSPDGLRLYLANHKYRDKWEHNEAELADAERMLEKWKKALSVTGGPRTAAALETEDQRTAFMEALANDLNTPLAARELDKLAKRILAANERRENLKNAQQMLAEMAALLGLHLDSPEAEKDVLAGWDEHLRKFQER